jgi:hypothetical protein
VKDSAQLLAGLAVHLLLIGAPAVAAALYAVRRGVKDVPVILAIALLASGVTAYAGFWAYYGNSLIGQTWSFLLLFGSVAAIVATCWGGGLDRQLLGRLATPLLLWVLGSCFVVFLGFVHGGIEEPIAMSAWRFSGQMLPSDNEIPRHFADWFATFGHHQKPPLFPPDWSMSDRPPLQVGYVLAERGIVNSTSVFRYEMLGTLVQTLWIVGIWAVLVAARLRARTRALAMFAVLLCDVAIVHGFFVWPKLIAAAFLLAALALVISPAWERGRLDLRLGALVGALLALAMLAHGSSIFGVIPLVLLAAFRGLPSWRWLAVALAAGLVLMVPWSAYQHFVDPPGNRLLKWQLGGDPVPSDKGTLEAIADGYGEVGFGGALELKRENFGAMAGWPLGRTTFEEVREKVDLGELDIATERIRSLRFFSLLPFLGLLLIGPVAMAFARLRGSPRDPGDWRFALVCLGFVAIACVCWGLLLFGRLDSRTTLHVGSLAVPLLAVVGCVAGLRACYPRLAAWVVGLNVLLTLALYAPSLRPEAGTSYSPLTALLATATLAGLAFVSFRGSGEAESRELVGAGADPDRLLGLDR